MIHPDTQAWRIGTPFPLHVANVNLPVLPSQANIGTLSAAISKPWKDKNGKIDLAKLFQVENEVAGLAHRK